MNCAAYIFPAVRGTQARREYYISMVPLEVIARIFQFADEELPPEVRSQRVLNKSRIPEIRDYILSNPSINSVTKRSPKLHNQLLRVCVYCANLHVVNLGYHIQIFSPRSN